MNSWDYPSPYQLEISVKESDIDGMGHANNACYVVWCEQVAWSHSQSLGLSVEDYQQLDRGVAINKAQYEYFLPTFKDDKLIASTWLTACDRKLRLERCFQITNARTGQTVLRGQWQLIGVTLSSGKATRFPEKFIEIYGGAVVEKSVA
jgi:acyl-CoA thioester hydrolase